VGSAVRVLANFGFGLPRVVDMYHYDAAEAKQMAAGCEDLVEQLVFYPTLEAAVADRTFVVGTTAQKRRRWRLEPLTQAVADFEDRWNGAAILFGNEKSGLTEEELTRCEKLMTIPTQGYTSLNLSHAVGVTAWEFATRLKPREPQLLPQMAPREVTEPMFAQMFAALEAISFLHPGQDERVKIMLRQMFSRNGLTKLDVQVLRGIWHQVNWLAKKGK
jgi:TrmH family RNA methyltransferase